MTDQDDDDAVRAAILHDVTTAVRQETRPIRGYLIVTLIDAGDGTQSIRTWSAGHCPECAAKTITLGKAIEAAAHRISQGAG